MSDRWVIIPFLNQVEMTWQAVRDALEQTVPCRVLLIDQGASREDREWMDRQIDLGISADPADRGKREYHRVLCWHFLPALPSLSAVWNRALEFVWELGGTEALVCNNDLLLHPQTYQILETVLHRTDALFVSAVGVKVDQYDPTVQHDVERLTTADAEGYGHPVSPGGPDFSCFLISREGHQKYPFDEGFIPAYHEDLDAHRRYMLGGDGGRIFSVNLPFLHYASGTSKAFTPEQQQKFHAGFGRSKAHYVAKWGGPVNQETFKTPFGREDLLQASPADAARWEAQAILPVTTPDLQRWWQANPQGSTVISVQPDPLPPLHDDLTDPEGQDG